MIDKASMMNAAKERFAIDFPEADGRRFDDGSSYAIIAGNHDRSAGEQAIPEERLALEWIVRAVD